MTPNLTPKLIEGRITLPTSTSGPKSDISESSPATSVMTDLTIIKPIQIKHNALIDAINEKMISSGVRLLFINGIEGNLIGLITSFDILGEKPLKFIQENGGRHDEIEASDIMTPITKFECISFDEIEKATVADIVDALENSRRHHMLIVDNSGESSYIRGLISASHVARVLGREISASQRAQSFAQLNKALS